MHPQATPAGVCMAQREGEPCVGAFPHPLPSTPGWESPSLTPFLAHSLSEIQWHVGNASLAQHQPHQQSATWELLWRARGQGWDFPSLILWAAYVGKRPPWGPCTGPFWGELVLSWGCVLPSSPQNVGRWRGGRAGVIPALLLGLWGDEKLPL